VLRCGAFYGADAAHTQQFAQGLIHHKLPSVGRGMQFGRCCILMTLPMHL
jgi:hypothetical protein